MNFRKGMSEEVEVNLTPLIDVVFLLLIFFMVTTTFDKDAKININLPTTENAAASPTKMPMEVIIDAQGKYFVDGREVLNNKPETLFRAMTQALNERGEKTTTAGDQCGCRNKLSSGCYSNGYCGAFGYDKFFDGNFAVQA